MRRLFGAGLVVVAIVTPVACGGSGEESPASGGTGATAGSGGSGATSGGDGGGSGGASGSSGSGGAPDLSLGCKGTPPAGATLAAAPKAYSGGTCPTLPRVTTIDVPIQSSGNARKFYLVVPTTIDPGESLPVLFLWYWLSASSQDFYDRANAQAAVDEQRFIAVIPEKKGDVQFVWPDTALDSTARMDEEAVFFDDMLTCVSEQFTVNKECVSSAGVSAGAMWTDVLMGMRSEYLASFISLSGGTGGVIKPFITPTHKMPGLLLWGGPTDGCFNVINFNTATADMEGHLIENGEFFIECQHNCGHGVPPVDAVGGQTQFHSIWQFAFDHPFWLKPGESPYNSAGLPSDMPSWCGIGKGSAVPRVGACEPPAC